MNLHLDERENLILLIGRPGSGKTYMAKALAYTLKKIHAFDICLCISGTMFSKKNDFKKWCDPAYCHDDSYLEKLIENILSLASELQKENKKILLIVDDLSSTAKWDLPCWKRLASNFRHYNLSIIICSQYPKMVTPTIRNNCDYVFCWRMMEKLSQDAIYDSCNVMGWDKKTFMNIYMNATKEKHYCLVIDKNHDTYFRFKAPSNLPDFKINNGKRVKKIKEKNSKELINIKEPETEPEITREDEDLEESSYSSDYSEEDEEIISNKIMDYRPAALRKAFPISDTFGEFNLF